MVSRRQKAEHIRKQIRTVFAIPSLRFGLDDVCSVTDPAVAIFRNQILQPLLPDCSVILDPFACVGLDAVSFTLSFPQAVIHCAQKTSTALERQRFAFLEHNLNHAWANASLTPTSASMAILYDWQFLTHIDLLYLDPPWFNRQNRKYSLTELLELISLEVLENLDLQRVKVVCLKTDFEMGPEILGLVLYPQQAQQHCVLLSCAGP